MTKSFKKLHVFEKRKEECSRIKKKYPERVPVIIEINNNNKNRLTLDKKKYLVPGDLTIGQFLYILRKRVKLGSEEALFLFINNHIMAPNTLLAHVQKNHRDKDGFLYGELSLEQTFG